MENKPTKQKFSDKIHYIFLAAIVVFAAIIRLWQLVKIPAGLYWDEMDLGYQAYSFLHTGRDYFGNLLPIHFHSLADYHTPFYIWTTLPFVAFMGMSAWSVRLPAVVLSLLSIIVFYFLVQKLLIPKKWALVSCLFMAVIPWHVQYSRQAFEAIAELPALFLGILFFYKSFDKPKYLVFAAFFFALTTYTYATADLFIPLFCLALILIYRHELLMFPKKYLAWSAIVICLVASVLYGDSFFHKGATRFFELSIFNDPTVAGQVNYYRLQASLSEGGEGHIGLSPNLFDRFAFNKPMFIANTLVDNYLTAFSNEFLFIKGDPNLRQSPSPNSIGELYRVAVIALPLGLVFLVLNRKRFGKRAQMLAAWIFLAPIPSVITTDGGNHATRLLLLFPALLILFTYGTMMLSDLLSGYRRIVIMTIYFGIWALEVVLFLQYYFSIYAFESAHVFQYGFDQAARIAFTQSKYYDTVVVDAHNDSDFMAYIFTNKIDPKTVQGMAPFHYAKLPSQTEAFKINNVYLLPPGERDWSKLIVYHQIPGHNLYIIAADEIADHQDLLGRYLTKIGTISYPDVLPVFYIYTQAQ